MPTNDSAHLYPVALSQFAVIETLMGTSAIGACIEDTCIEDTDLDPWPSHCSSQDSSASTPGSPKSPAPFDFADLPRTRMAFPARMIQRPFTDGSQEAPAPHEQVSHKVNSFSHYAFDLENVVDSVCVTWSSACRCCAYYIDMPVNYNY